MKRSLIAVLIVAAMLAVPSSASACLFGRFFARWRHAAFYPRQHVSYVYPQAYSYIYAYPQAAPVYQGGGCASGVCHAR